MINLFRESGAPATTEVKYFGDMSCKETVPEESAKMHETMSGKCLL